MCTAWCDVPEPLDTAGLGEREATLIPRFQESCHPFDLNTRGLEDMTNAPLQRSRQS
jgi:hypothetical protein